MAAKIGLFLLISLLGSMGGIDPPPELIVWNVGQGQWATVIDANGCWHLDMGGEFAPWREILEKCRRRMNRISLSHWDMDHIVFAESSRTKLPDLCLINAPVGNSSSKKMEAIASLPKCQSPSPFAQWADPAGKTANAKSWVVNWRGVLAPGDSPIKEEAKWIHQIGGLGTVRLLILGHHGSRTSTSPELLAALPQLQVAVSSARFKRYGHPHIEVVQRLAHRHIPLLRTEEWGTLHFRLD